MVAVMAGAAGCVGAEPERLTLRGVVVTVEGSGPVAVDRFTVRADDGRSVTFTADRLDASSGKPPGHLREHLSTAEPVTVTYVVVDGRNVALRYDD